MKLQLPRTLKKALLIAVLAVSAQTLHAGSLVDRVGLDAYKDLALNLGIFEKGATNVSVYNTDGSLSGVIPVVPDFGALTDPEGLAQCASAGGQSWLIDAAHNGNPTTLSFSDKYGAEGTVVEEEYSVVKVVENNREHTGSDHAVLRTSKVITDVVSFELPGENDTYYQTLSGLSSMNLYRAGSGEQAVYDESGKRVGYVSAFNVFTAGDTEAAAMAPEADYRSHFQSTDGRTRDENGTLEQDTYRNYLYVSDNIRYAGDENPMPINATYGDSGSPVIAFNEETQSFQYVGNATRSPNNFEGRTHYYFSPEFYDAVISNSEKQLTPSVNRWTVGAADAAGFVTLKQEGGDAELSIRALKSGERGDTSTNGTRATNAELWESLDWVLNNGDTELNFTADVNTGAGSIQFRRGSDSSAENPASYKLSSSDDQVQVNSAGYIIDEHVQVTSTLTGEAGDEWRIVGENARIKDGQYDIYGGSFHLEGTGDNLASLDLGVGVSVFLDRDGGYAAQNVQINTGAKVFLMQEDQINGLIAYGTDGGTLHLNGQNLSLDSSKLYVHDRDARMVNVISDTESTVDYSYGADEDHKLSYLDGSALQTTNNAKLHLNFAGQNADSSIALTNTINIAGDLTVNTGSLHISGYQVSHAGSSALGDPGDELCSFIEDDWAGVNVRVNALNVKDAKLYLDSYSHTTAHSTNIDASSELHLQSHASLSSNVDLRGMATFADDSSYSGHLTLRAGSNLTAGAIGHHAIGLTAEAHSQAQFHHAVTLTAGSSNAGTLSILSGGTLEGSFFNSGSLHLDGELVINELFVNTGTLSFGNDFLLNINDFSPVIVDATTLSFDLFSGVDSAAFDALDNSNIIFDKVGDYVWDFYSDGRIVGTTLSHIHDFDGGLLKLSIGSTGFGSGDFENHNSIDFITADATMELMEADLVTQRLHVSEGLNLTIQSSAGHSISTEHLLLESDSSVTIVGESIAEDVVIGSIAGTTNTTIILDMQGLNISGKRWLDTHNQALILRDGYYNNGDLPLRLGSVYIEEDAGFIISGIERMSTELKGAGLLQADNVNTFRLSQASEFHGTLRTTASEIYFEEVTGASIALTAEQNLRITGAGSYAGSLSGSGDIYTETCGILLQNVNNFTGALIMKTGTVTIGGSNIHLSDFSFESASSITLLENTHMLYSKESTYQTNNFVYNLAKGSHFEMRNTQYRVGEGAISLTGGGAATWLGISLSDPNGKSNLRVEKDTTLHIVGTNDYATAEGRGSFQLSEQNAHNEIFIHGTLISDAAISSWDGHASIYIEDGGKLELKKGAQIQLRQDLTSNIYAKSGSTLALGNQIDVDTDFSHGGAAKSLQISMESGSTLAASGEGIISTPHSFNWEAGGSHTISSAENQDFTVEQTVDSAHLNVTGEGVTRLGSLTTDSLSVAAESTLHISETASNLQAADIQGRVWMDGTNDLDIALSGGKGAELHLSGTGTQRVHATGMSEYAGDVHIGAGKNFVLGSSAHADTSIIISAGGIFGLAENQQHRFTQSEANDVSHRIELGKDSSLSYAHELKVSEGNTLSLSGEGSLKAEQNISVSGTFSATEHSAIAGDITLVGDSAHLDLSEGGNIAGRITQYDGVITIGSSLTLNQSIVSHGGSLNFAHDTQINVDHLVAKEEHNIYTYQIFTGNESSSFATLSCGNIAGLGCDDFIWDFNANGTLIGTRLFDELAFSGGELNLSVGVGGFDGDQTFADNARIRFQGEDAVLNLGSEELYSHRIVVDGVELTMKNQVASLHAPQIILSEGASLVIEGRALSAGSRIEEAPDVRSSSVILDMQGAELMTQEWLTDYSGKVELKNGIYHFSSADEARESTMLHADATLDLDDRTAFSQHISGDGTLRSSATSELRLDNLDSFSGRIESRVAELHLLSSTAAQIEVDSSTALHLSSGMTYSGAIGGEGSIHATGEGTTTVEQLSDYRGSIHTGTGTMVLGGSSHAIAGIDISSGATLQLQENTGLSSVASYYVRSSTDYSIDLAQNAILFELGVDLAPDGGTITLKGDGVHHVNGLSIGAGNADILENSTLHLYGTDSFNLSTGAQDGVVNVEGTLISESRITAFGSGSGTVNVKAGGTLDLREGGQYIGVADSTINIESGGTLLFGQQDSSTDYAKISGGSLLITLENGAALGASSAGTTLIQHSFEIEETSEISMTRHAGQDIHLTKGCQFARLNLIGEGRASIHVSSITSSYSLYDGELNFMESVASLNNLNLMGQGRLVMSNGFAGRSSTEHIGTGVLQVGEICVAPGDNALSVDNSVERIEFTHVKLTNKGGMSIAALDKTEKGIAVATSFSNVHVSNAQLSSNPIQSIAIESAHFENTDISSSRLHVSDEHNVIEGGDMGADLQFIMNGGATLRFENTHFSSLDESTFSSHQRATVTLEDVITISNSSMDVAISQSVTLDGEPLDIYAIEGLNYVLGKATIEGRLYLELNGVDIGSVAEDGSFTFSLTGVTSEMVEGVDFSKITMSSNGMQFAMQSLGSQSGGQLLFNAVAVPEPSTASLSLLALTALLARRRRQRTGVPIS